MLPTIILQSPHDEHLNQSASKANQRQWHGNQPTQEDADPSLVPKAFVRRDCAHGDRLRIFCRTVFWRGVFQAVLPDNSESEGLGCKVTDVSSAALTAPH